MSNTTNKQQTALHTPWTFDGTSVLDSKGRNACTKVNGPLIAAAPELLEALRQLEWAHSQLLADRGLH